MKKTVFAICCAFIGLLVVATFLASGAGANDLQNKLSDYDLVGSRWCLEYDSPNFGRREYHLIFREGGKVINTHPNERTPDDDTWEVRGKEVVLMFNNGYAVYTGELSDRDHMVGNATSKNGGAWEWKAYRIVKREKK